MTPLTLNLLAEEQQAERASAHDPVKYGIAIGMMILALVAASGVLLTMLARGKVQEAERLQKQWDALSAGQKTGTFRMLKGFAEDLVAINKQRPLLAPQLARIKDVVPASIYLTRMGFRVNVEVTRVNAPASPPDEAGNVKVRPLKVQNTEQVALRLEGMAVGARPEIEVDSFLRVLRTDSVLSNQMKEVTLRSIGRGAAGYKEDPQKIMAQFVIECLYREGK